MWDDFNIGNVASHATAIAVVGNLSENNSDYWWTHSEFSIGGKVSKATPQGERIARMVDSCVPADTIDNFLLTLAVPHMSPDRIVGLFAQIKKDSFAEGEERRAYVIREALGI